MAFDPFTAIGSIISGVGSVASAFGGSEPSGPTFAQQNLTWRKRAKQLHAYDKKMAEDAFNRTMWADNRKVQRVVADAKKAGIHPLAALGAQLNSPTASGVSSANPGGELGTSRRTGGGGDVGAALGGIGSSVAALAGPSRLEEAQIRNLEASTAQMLLDARSRTLASRLVEVGQGGRGNSAARAALSMGATGESTNVDPLLKRVLARRSRLGLPSYADRVPDQGIIVPEIVNAAEHGIALVEQISDAVSSSLARVQNPSPDGPAGVVPDFSGGNF